MGWVETYIAEIWFLIIGFFVLYYAVADGSDLGVGILSLFARNEEDRGIMMASLQSVWQDNQTWLVLLGGMLFGAFPLFYSVALSALYIPLVVMLAGLIFRGIAFEFRERSGRTFVWSLCFGIGSLVTTVSQGLTLGGIFYGLPMDGNSFAGTQWSWLHPYSTVFSLGVISGYAMLGANYLFLKTSGVVQRRSVFYSALSAAFTLFIAAVIYLWTVARHPYMAQKWQAMPGVFTVALFPFLALCAFFLYAWSLRRRWERGPFLWNAVFVFCAFIGISVGFYPYIIPNMVTIRTAAGSSPKTLLFMLAVMVILLPVILVYTGYKRRVFRGKVGSEGYGD